MLFHTWTFLLFFAVFYPVYLLVKGTRLKLPWLLTASYVFYGWWNPVYLILILWAGLWMANAVYVFADGTFCLIYILPFCFLCTCLRAALELGRPSTAALA